MNSAQPLGPETAPADSKVVGLVAVGLILATAAVFVSWLLNPVGFLPKLAELILQLGLFAILGAVIKYVSKDVSDKRIAELRANDKRLEFLRRMRAAHVRIANSWLLLKAHNSAKTYAEQLQALILVKPEIEEIAADLGAAGGHGPFGEKTRDIKAGIDEIVSYLEEGIDEYVKFHNKVDLDWKAGKSLDESITERDMAWLKEFKAAAGLPGRYDTAVEASKGAMRQVVFGPGT